MREQRSAAITIAGFDLLHRIARISLRSVDRAFVARLDPYSADLDDFAECRGDAFGDRDCLLLTDDRILKVERDFIREHTGVGRTAAKANSDSDAPKSSASSRRALVLRPVARGQIGLPGRPKRSGSTTRRSIGWRQPKPRSRLDCLFGSVAP
jgi:hypothetical protein